MKKNYLSAMFLLSGFLVLSACGTKAATKTYTLTFHQTEPGDIQDVKLTVTPGVTTQQDAWEVEPDINPKEGYEAEWEEYNVLEMTSDLTIEPIYTLISYTATFINSYNDDILGTSTFTIEDDVIPNIPELPHEFGYTYAWQPYEIKAENMTIYCNREANVHTIKFFEDEAKTKQVGETQTFTIETVSINEPEVPYKEGFDGFWPEYNLRADQDIEVVAQYIIHQYYVQFTFEGQPVGEPVGYNADETWADIEKPATPEKTGYTVSWPENVTLELNEIGNPQIVEAIVIANQYTVSYEGTTETTSVTYDSPYQLLSPGGINGWFYEGNEVAVSGEKWTIASNVTLTKEFNFPTYRAVDFEDGNNRIISNNNNFTSIEVIDGEGLNGSKALACVTDREGFLNIDKDYLDKIFSDTNIKALSFYAKGTLETNNFRHITVDKQYVGNNENIISCYEVNSTGHGISNNYKQFYLTRGVYSQMGDDDWSIKYGGANGPHTLYLDNFQASRYDYFDKSYYGLENGKMDNPDANTFYLRNATSGAAQFLATGSFGPNKVQANYDIQTEGQRSIGVDKANGQVNFYLRGDFARDQLPDEGIIFDLYVTTNFNGWWEGGDTGAIVDGNDKHFVSKVNESVQKGIWYTFHFDKNRITSDGRFLMAKGSTEGTIYIDNIRIATSGLRESFEGDVFAEFFADPNDANGGYFNVCNRVITTVAESNALRDAALDYLLIAEWGFVREGGITNEKASDGGYSLKMVFNKENGTVRFNPRLVKLMSDTSTVSIDFYTDDITFTNEKMGIITQGQWTTVTFTKADFNNINAYRLFRECFTVGTLYIDNIVVNL